LILWGGSYFVEWLTDKVEKEANEYIQKIDDLGGMLEAIDKGYPQAEIANSAYHFQRLMESKDKVMVGVNKYTESDEKPLDVLYIDKSYEDRQKKLVQAVKKRRDAKKVEQCLSALKKVCEGTENTMPYILDAAKAHCSVEEICAVMKKVFGEYRDPGTY